MHRINSITHHDQWCLLYWLLLKENLNNRICSNDVTRWCHKTLASLISMHCARKSIVSEGCPDETFCNLPHTHKSLEFRCIASPSKKAWASTSSISCQAGMVVFSFAKGIYSLPPFLTVSNSSYCTRKGNLSIGIPPFQESLLSETVSTSKQINLELVINIK